MRFIQRLYCLIHSFFLSYFLRISWLAILLSLRFWHKSDQHDRAFVNAIGSVLKLSCQTVKAGESRFLLWIDLIRKEQIQLTIHKLWFHSLAALSIWFILTFQEARVKIEKGGSLKLSKDVVTRLQSEFDQEQEASLQTQSDPSPSTRRHLTRRDSLISKFFSRKKSEKEIRTFSGQFPPRPAFCDPAPSSEPAPGQEEEEHIYSLPQLTPPTRPQSSRTSLTQLHLLRSNSSAKLQSNMKTFLNKTSRTSENPSTNFKKCSEEENSAPTFEKCHDRISMSSPSSAKSVSFSPKPESTPNTRPVRRTLPQRARLRSPPSKRSLKYSSLSSASPSSSPTSGMQKISQIFRFPDDYGCMQSNK